MTDMAGIHFVVTTPVQTLDKQDRKAIRGHATRAGKAGRQSFQLGSWISPHRDLGALTTAKEVLTSKSELSAPSPRRVGGDFCGLQLPSGVEPYMIQDLVKCMYSPLLVPIHLPFDRNSRSTFTDPN